MQRLRWFVLSGLVLLAGCGAAVSQTLVQVRAIHGRAGPFAVAGFRIGQRALKELGAEHGSHGIEVIHLSPREVQWSCIADGAQASTGTSMGQLTLFYREAPREGTRTIVQNRAAGRALEFELRADFIARFLNTPMESLERAGETVATMPDEAIFEMRTSTPQ